MTQDIASKIKVARLGKNLTQEQVAEFLGVTRRTISNWENGKTYPDIINVIKMSEYYDISLDESLKGKQKMSDYYQYLEESTNVVKSTVNKNKFLFILSYLFIWMVSMIAFWFFPSSHDSLGYSLMFLWVVLPLTTFILSFIIGKNNLWSDKKWMTALFFGTMYMTAEYGTFKMANNIAFE